MAIVLEREVRIIKPPIERVDHLPDGAASLCYLLFAENRGTLVIAGPWTRALYTWAAPFVLAIHVGFPPGGAYPYFGVPLDVLAARLVPAREIWGALADRLLDELLALGVDLDEPSMHARLRVIDRALAQRLRAQERFEPAAAAIARAAVERLARAPAPIRDLASELHISDRNLRRAFGAAVGVSPKAFARIARFRRVTAHRRRADGRWAEIASAAGYADQSHLANEFRALAGVSPSDFGNAAAADYLRTACPIVARGD